MAIESWSAPNQDPHTLSALSAGYQVNLAPIFSAIMEDRRRQQQQQQQQFSSMMSQIGSGVSSVAGAYGKSAQAGQADDAANRAIYMSQNPGSMQQLSSMGANQFDQSYVPDYGGTSGAQAYKFTQDQEKRDLQNALEQQKIDAIQQKLSGGGGHGDRVPVTLSDGSTVYVTGNMAARMSTGSQSQGNTTDKIQKQFERMGITADQIPTIAGISDADLQGGGHYPTSGAKMTEVRARQLSDMAKQYMESKSQVNDLHQAMRSSTGAGNLNQGDVDQAAQAMGIGGGSSAAGSLKQEAQDAISRGADPAAVRARYKQLTGSDL